MKYTTPKLLENICPNSVVQEIYEPNYEVELDFSGSLEEQRSFLKRREIEIQTEEVTTLVFNNDEMPNANMACITHKNGLIQYQLSITFDHCKWQGNKSLYKFIPRFISSCNNKGLNIIIEAEDDYGFYLLLTLEIKPELLLEQRLREVSSKLNEIMIRLK